MAEDAIIAMPDIPVTYVAGAMDRPIPQQAPAALEKLEAKLPSLKGRRFYGVVVRNEYRVCVVIAKDDNLGALPHPRWTIPGGRYRAQEHRSLGRAPTLDRPDDSRDVWPRRFGLVPTLHRILSQPTRVAAHGAPWAEWAMLGTATR